MGTNNGTRGFLEGTKRFKSTQTFKRRLVEGPGEEWENKMSNQWGGWAEEHARIRDEAKKNNMTVEEWTKLKERETRDEKHEAATAKYRAAQEKKEKNKKKKQSKKKSKAAKAAKKNEIMIDEDTKVGKIEATENEDKITETENMDEVATEISGNKINAIDDQASSTTDADAYITSNECKDPDMETTDDEGEITLAENKGQEDNAKTPKQIETMGEEASFMMDPDFEIELDEEIDMDALEVAGILMHMRECTHDFEHGKECTQDSKHTKDFSPQCETTSGAVPSGAVLSCYPPGAIPMAVKANRFSLTNDVTTKQKKKKIKAKGKGKAKAKSIKSTKRIILSRPETTGASPTVATSISPGVTSSGRKLRVDAPSWFPCTSPTASLGATSFPSPFAKPFSPSSFIAASSSPFAAPPSPAFDENTNDRRGKAIEVENEDHANNYCGDDADAGYSADVEDHRSLRVAKQRSSFGVPRSSLGIPRSVSSPGIACSSSGIPRSVSGAPLTSPGVAPGGGYLNYNFHNLQRQVLMREIALRTRKREQAAMRQEILAQLAPFPSPTPSAHSRANSVSSVGSWTGDDEFLHGPK